MSTTGHRLDGVAVVSDLAASLQPLEAAQTLKGAFQSWSALPCTPATIKDTVAKPSRVITKTESYTSKTIKDGVAVLLGVIKKIKPLIHQVRSPVDFICITRFTLLQITNIVVANQSANATLALGASPIMATAPQEMYDLSRILSALLVNFGTVTDKDGMLLAGLFANSAKKPVVFDPVGVGATEFRRKVAAELLNTWQPSVIKGNAGELASLAGSAEVSLVSVGFVVQSDAFPEAQSKGVDSVGGGFADPATFVRDLARKQREFY